MKSNWKALCAICFAVLLLASCRKETNKVNTTANSSASQHNQDVSNTKTESDNVNTDVNNALTGTSGFGKNGSTEGINICGATIDSSHQHDQIPYIVITFDGQTVCSSPRRIRSGTIKVELISGAHWHDAGATLRITHTNYKVQFPDLDNHYVTFNGTKYLTDVTGYNVVSWYFSGALTAQLRERSYDMTVTFENGETAQWHTARLTTWDVTQYTHIVATVNGDTTIGGKTIDSWGITRYGTNFQTEMVQPWKSGTDCGWWRPTQGKYTSTTDDFTVTATFGTDANGNAQSSGCPNNYRLDWTLNNANHDNGYAVLSYW